MYTVEGLRHGIEQAKGHIKMLQRAIEEQRVTIKDYKIMIADIEEAEKKKAEAEAGVHVEVVNGDTE